jgi:signal transduction histidine kinase
MVDECWETVAVPEASLRVETSGRIEASPSRLKRLIENLMRNAIEHGGDGVTVTAGRIDGGFFVEDDGPGIPESERREVFDVGYSTAAAGNGLGLHIVREIADAHGWDVDVTTGANGGARFEFTGVDVAV